MKHPVIKLLLPIVLTILTFFTLIAILFGFIHLLNLLPVPDKIIPVLRLADVFVGLTIYLKTSVDFGMFIGNLMHKNPGTKNRIAIELGTAIGNAMGTFVVLLLWTLFKEVPILMAGMIFFASLVLLSMAESGLQEFINASGNIFAKKTLFALNSINRFFAPVLKLILPNIHKRITTKQSFTALILFSFSIPLILGLDDFAGYIPLFNIINVFGFATGVFLGHMLLNVALFISPKHTIATVKQPLIALIGSIAFIGIAVWGFVEIYHLLPFSH